MIYQHKETELFSVSRSYTLTFEDGNENEYMVGVETNYQTNPDFEEIENIEFLDGCEKLTDKQKKEIESWINDNESDWRTENE